MDSTGFIGNQYWLWITFFTESHQCQRSLKYDSNLSQVWINDYNKFFFFPSPFYAEYLHPESRPIPAQGLDLDGGPLWPMQG